MMNLKNNQLL